jgi:hypothetical protein
MSLIIGSVRFPVLQSSEDAIKLSESHSVPEGDAVLETVVDGRSHRRAIRVSSAHRRPEWVSIVDR